MKPRARPGKVYSGGKRARALLTGAKSINASQIPHGKKENFPDKKAGRGGRRANWETGYEEGLQYAWKQGEDMRRLPKRGSRSRY